MLDRMADKLTTAGKPGGDALLDARPATLPFDPKDLLAMRVSRARYAEMCGVSRQSVSDWVAKSWITLGPDGLLDPVVATRQLLRNADPQRLRARIFREALATHRELHARIQSLETKVAEANAATADMLSLDEVAVRLDRFIDGAAASLGLKFFEREVLVNLACTVVLGHEEPPADSRGTLPPTDLGVA